MALVVIIPSIGVSDAGGCTDSVPRLSRRACVAGCDAFRAAGTATGLQLQVGRGPGADQISFK